MVVGGLGTFLGGCGWLWLVVGGCGWLWVVVGGCGSLWLVESFSITLFGKISCLHEGKQPS